MACDCAETHEDMESFEEKQAEAFLELSKSKSVESVKETTKTMGEDTIFYSDTNAIFIIDIVDITIYTINRVK